MRKMFLLIFVLIIYSSCGGKKDIVNVEANKQDCKTNRFQKFLGNKLVFEEIYTFDNKTNISTVTSKTYDILSLVLREYENFYDENLLVRTYVRIGGRKEKEISYIYHTNKSLKSITTTDDKNSYYHVIEYNEKGQEIRYSDTSLGNEFITIYDTKGNILTKNVIQNNVFFWKEVNEYNKDFLIVKKTQTFRNQSIQITTYTYDSSNNLIESVTNLSKNLYTYTNQKLLINQKQYYNGKLTDDIKYEYNDKKQLTKILTSIGDLTSFYNSDEYNYYDNGERKEWIQYNLKTSSNIQTYKAYYSLNDNMGNSLDIVQYNEDGTQYVRYQNSYTCK